MREVLDFFNVMVTEGDTGMINTSLLETYGLVLDFIPTNEQTAILMSKFAPLDVRTLFTPEERKNSTVKSLVTKQLFHYLEVYGLGKPGMFDLVTENGTIMKANYVKGVSRDELEVMVQKLLYMSAPIKDTDALAKIIKEYDISYDLNAIANNELRVILYDGTVPFSNGDDAVRYICFKATGDAMLIKSKEVLGQIKNNNSLSSKFFNMNAYALSQVYNRHKDIILSAKKYDTKTVINKIGRMSKKNHVPVKESLAKSFVAFADANRDADLHGIAEKFSTRDLFKIMNHSMYKMIRNQVDVFTVRNGKQHVKQHAKQFNSRVLLEVSSLAAGIVVDRLDHLKGKTILMDRNVRYSLPVSRKQTIGNLPFGTRIDVDAKAISAGIYWENDWGASDLDLSTIDTSGNRVGWGAYGAYGANEIIYSGDVTWADPSAMEFMTSPTILEKTYGLFVNIYSGEIGSQAEVVVGTEGKNQWMDKVLFREKIQLKSRENVIGFIQDGSYVAFNGRLSNNRASFNGSPAIIAKALVETPRVQEILEMVDGVTIHTERQPGVKYDYDLSYENFTYDKLEELFKLN